MKTSVQSDAEFAYETVKITMRDFAVQTWGSWHDKDSWEAAIRDTRLGKIKIIYMGTAKAGTLQYELTETTIVVSQLYIIPAFQKSGLGSEVIKELKRKSMKLNLPIELSVLRVNSATAFYLKHEFTIEKETAERIFMQFSTLA